MAIIGCFVAIVIVKCLFGGIGQNFANPALVARIVLFISFATNMTSWPVPGERILLASDAKTAATPLGLLQYGDFDNMPSNMSLFLGTITKIIIKDTESGWQTMIVVKIKPAQRLSKFKIKKSRG